MIEVMSEYWKIARLLRPYIEYLILVQKRMPAILEGEPKYSSIETLTRFRTNAVHTRTSILDFNGILRPDGDGYVRPGDECDLHAEDQNFATEPQSRALVDDEHIVSSDGRQHDASTAADEGPLPDSWASDTAIDSNIFGQQYRPELLSFLGVSGPEQLDADYQSHETFNPFFDLQPWTLLHSQGLNLDYFDAQQDSGTARVPLL